MKLVYLANLAPTCSSAEVITEAERKTLLQILEGGKNGAHFKKITHNIWSARLNKRARFLIMLSPSVTIVLEKFTSHKDYIEKLKNKNLCQHYLGHLTEYQIQAIFSEDAPQAQDAEFTPEELLNLKEAFSQAPEEVYFSLGGKLVALSAQQQACTKSYLKTGNTSTTRIIQGGPGTGKTLVLISSFEKAYLEAIQEETKHSTEAFHQFIYLTTTPKLAESIGGHLETILPKNPQPFLSMSYQDFACMVDPALNPNPEISDPIKPKAIVDEEHFVSWCEEKKLYNINPDETGCHREFYKKLYKEFRIISGSNNLEEYTQLGVCESSFQKDSMLRELFFNLYTDYTKKYVDLNFYDLRPAIQVYKAKQPDFFTPKLFVDETQNLSRRQVLNLIEYAKEPENISIASDLNQRVYDAVPNSEFIQSHWLNKEVTVDKHVLSEYYRVPKAVAKTLNKLSRLIEAFNQGLDCKTPGLIHCTEKAEVGNISQTLRSQLNGSVAEHYKALSARPNCIVVVGDPSLLPEAKTVFNNTDFIYTLDGIEDGIIGLEADCIIGYKILKGFSPEELTLLLPFLKDNTFCSHKPKDKNDKSKQALVLKLHRLYVGVSRPLKEFIFIVNDNIAPTPTSKKQRKPSKAVENPEHLFMSQLLATEELKNEKEEPPVLSKETLHQEWVEACRTTILLAKDYERAKAICIRHTITAEELNLALDHRVKIPQIYHKFFFKFEATSASEPNKPTKELRSKQKSAFKAKDTKEPKKENYSVNMIMFITKLLHNFTEKRVKKLFQYSHSIIKKVLFETLVNDKYLWDVINHDQQQIIYKVLSKGDQRDNILTFINIFKHPQVLCDFAEYQMNLNTELNKSYTCLLYEAAHDKGYPYAQYQLGFCYQFGHGKSIDLVKAAEFYQLASSNGEPNADAALGTCYEYGLGGLKVDLQRAATLYKSAAARKVLLAYFPLGLCYAQGKGLAININEAVNYFELADSGCKDAEAQLQLGLLYRDGKAKEGMAMEQSLLLAKQYFNKAIQNGNVEAYNNLGDYYETIEKNNSLASDCYILGSAKDNQHAHYNLGRCYYHGLGVENNITEAKRYYRLAQSKGFDIPKEVQILLAESDQTNMQEEPETKTKSDTNYENAKSFATILLNSFNNLDLLEKRINKLFSYAPENIIMVLITITLKNGKNFWESLSDSEVLEVYNILAKNNTREFIEKFIRVFNNNPKTLYNFAIHKENNQVEMKKIDIYSFMLYEAASNQNFAPAQYALAEFYYAGAVRPKNLTLSFDLLLLSAGQDHPFAQNMLGSLYEQGIDGRTAVNIALAQTYYTLASQAGITIAHYNLGLLYAKKIHVDNCLAPLKKAKELFTIASEQEDGPAQLELGLIYEYGGEEIKQDYALAVEFYQKAIHNDAYKAYSQLGHCYEYGKGVAKNNKKASELYLSGSQYFEPIAIFNLARCYEKGIGFQKNEASAKHYYLLAKEHGFKYDQSMEAYPPLARSIIFEDKSPALSKTKMKCT